MLNNETGRMCKHLAATEEIVEVDEDLYLLTDYTASLRHLTRHSMIGHP